MPRHAGGFPSGRSRNAAGIPEKALCSLRRGDVLVLGNLTSARGTYWSCHGRELTFFRNQNNIFQKGKKQKTQKKKKKVIKEEAKVRGSRVIPSVE